MDEEDISRKKHDLEVIVVAAAFLALMGINHWTSRPNYAGESSRRTEDPGLVEQYVPDAGVPEAAPIDESDDGYAWPIPETEAGWNDVGSCHGMREFVDEEGKVYRRFHDGIDISAVKGSDVVSVADGVVEAVCRVEKECNCSTLKDEDCAERCAGKASCGGEGNSVSIRHGADNYSHYLHLDKVVKGLEKGSVVELGERIGRVGDSGQSRAPHLHFSRTTTPRRPGGVSKDPFCDYSDLLSRLYLERRQCIKKYGSESGYDDPRLALRCVEYKEETTLASAGRL